MLLPESLRETGFASLDSPAFQRIFSLAHEDQPDALYLLALLKLYGHEDVVAQDVAAGVKLLRSLASSGHRDAEFALGVLHLTGEGGVRASDREGAAWLASSANHGHADAKWVLATLYNEGRGVPQNPARALALLQEAAGLRNPRALFHLGVMVEYGRGGAPRNFSLAAELYREASGYLLPEALHYLALLHASGRGVPKNTPQAVQLLGRAAELGFAPAMLRLGEMYADGDGVALDYTQALDWFTRAATAATDGEYVHAVAMQRQRELSQLLSDAEEFVRAQERVLGVRIRVRLGVIEAEI
ncbi:hypothetical protein ATCC90586_001863 [Pythium insidiosum]|nr:hypothetical protein ATCC90586_001863 [Pythium insidiosum]